MDWKYETNISASGLGVVGLTSSSGIDLLYFILWYLLFWKFVTCHYYNFMFFTAKKIIWLQNSWAISSKSLRQTVGIVSYTTKRNSANGSLHNSYFRLSWQIHSFMFQPLHKGNNLPTMTCHSSLSPGWRYSPSRLHCVCLIIKRRIWHFMKTRLEPSIFHAPLSSIFADTWLWEDHIRPVQWFAQGFWMKLPWQQFCNQTFCSSCILLSHS